MMVGKIVMSLPVIDNNNPILIIFLKKKKVIQIYKTIILSQLILSNKRDKYLSAIIIFFIFNTIYFYYLSEYKYRSLICLSMKKEKVGEWLHVDQLTPWDKNPRFNDQAIEKIAQSIKKFGFC